MDSNNLDLLASSVATEQKAEKEQDGSGSDTWVNHNIAVVTSWVLFRKFLVWYVFTFHGCKTQYNTFNNSRIKLSKFGMVISCVHSGILPHFVHSNI